MGIIIVSVALLVLLMNACTRIPEYSVGFVNHSGREIDEVSVYYNNKLWALPTPLVVRGRATEGPIPLAIPPEVEVRLIDRGEHISIPVSLKDVPKSGFEGGTIWFVVNTNDTVDVWPIKDGDDEAEKKLGALTRVEGEYVLGFVNKTGQDLQTVCVYYGGQRAGSCGDILARVRVGYSDPLTNPPPPEAEVRWKENGADQSVQVKLDGTITNGYSNNIIYFVIRGTNAVDVKLIKAGDDKGGADLVR